MQIETSAVHSGRRVDVGTGAVSVPIHLPTIFECDADRSFSRRFEYSRVENSNRRSLETCLAALEGGQAAVTSSSGTAARQDYLPTKE